MNPGKLVPIAERLQAAGRLLDEARELLEPHGSILRDPTLVDGLKVLEENVTFAWGAMVGEIGDEYMRSLSNPVQQHAWAARTLGTIVSLILMLTPEELAGLIADPHFQYGAVAKRIAQARLLIFKDSDQLPLLENQPLQFAMGTRMQRGGA